MRKVGECLKEFNFSNGLDGDINELPQESNSFREKTLNAARNYSAFDGFDGEINGFLQDLK